MNAQEDPKTPTERNTREHLVPFILDFDGAVTKQARVVDRAKGQVIDVRNAERHLRGAHTTQTAFWVTKLIESVTGPGISGKVMVYGSSDAHNLTDITLEMLDQPVTIVHFDNHTDMIRFNPPGKKSQAGGWVVNAIRLPNIRKVIQFGIQGDLKPSPVWPIGATGLHYLEGWLSGRVETFPVDRETTTFWGIRATGRTASAQFQARGLGTQATWRPYRLHGGIEAIWNEVVSRVPTEAVYISIDKDVLRKEDCFTNYYNGAQGEMTLEELCSVLRLIGQTKRIVGADINGDGSPTSHLRGFEGRMLHLKSHGIDPALYTDAAMIALNERSNMAILDALGAV
jgi:arginase family enzyme